MSHTFIDYKNNAIKVNETPLIISCLFLIKVNETDFDYFFPMVKSQWFYQFEYCNWGGIDLELDSVITNYQLQQQFQLMIAKTKAFLAQDESTDVVNLAVISSFPVMLGMTTTTYPKESVIEFLGQLDSLFI